MLSEFELIKNYFIRARAGRALLGIGDDCAMIAPTPGKQLAISSDMLVEDRHFFAGADPRMLGHKSLAVNLSDLAAMGATPLGFTLALALPQADPVWLEAFAGGLFALADEFDCELIGGDTTKGPLNICITVFGELSPGQALLRNSAQAGDDIWISGELGDARLALAHYWNEHLLPEAALALAAPRMHAPTPRIALGEALAQRGLARAAIDISDGLAGDLRHILTASGLGATIDADALPAGPVLAQQDTDLRRRFCVAGGDDYELCFSAAPEHRAAILQAGKDSGTAVTRVGRMETARGMRLVDRDGKALTLKVAGFDHFSS